MPVISLPDRAAIEIVGEDAKPFLQGLTTCEVETIAPGEAGFGALLSPQGKILFDFLIFPESGRVLLDAPRAFATDLVKRLNFYKLRAKIEVRAFRLDEKEPFIGALLENAPAPPGAIVYQDPRAKNLGRRAICFDSIADTAEQSVYELRRITAVAPLAGVDFHYGDVFPHDVNMDILHGLSFDKGCYIGQEVVARMQHRGGVRRRTVPVTIHGPAPKPGAEISTEDRLIGTMGSAYQDRGLALVRLDRAREILARGGVFYAGETRVVMDLSLF